MLRPFWTRGLSRLSDNRGLVSGAMFFILAMGSGGCSGALSYVYRNVSPLHPTGNPMIDGVGPGAWAIRPQGPDLTHEGTPRIVPMRVATDFSIDSRDPNPIGMTVRGADGAIGGTVVDAWVDRAEPIIRYLELDSGGRRILLPMTMARVGREGVRVASILGSQFADVPGLSNPDQVTLQEEDRVCAYYASGHLYATPQRSEPLL